MIWARLAELQRADPLFGAIIRYLEHQELPENNPALSREVAASHELYFLDDNNELFRMTGDHLRLCVPHALRENVLYMSHSLAASGHLGIKKTFHRLKRHYFWVGMYQDCTIFVRRCAACQFCKPPPHLSSRQKLAHRPLPQGVWDILHLDIWAPGGGRTTAENSKYVIAVKDAFSKYVVARTIPQKNSEEVRKFLTREVFDVFGVPNTLVCDNAGEFKGDIQTHTFQVYGVTRRLIPPHSPKSNGEIERFFRTLRHMVASTSIDDAREWDRNLAHVVYAL